jgi:hypothetical protein
MFVDGLGGTQVFSVIYVLLSSLNVSSISKPNFFMTNWFHDVNSDEELDQLKTSTIQMTDLVNDDILYSGRGTKKDAHWSDDYKNIINI